MTDERISLKYVGSNKGMAEYFNVNRATLGNWCNMKSFPEPLDMPHVSVRLYDIREVEKWLKRKGIFLNGA